MGMLYKIGLGERAKPECIMEGIAMDLLKELYHGRIQPWDRAIRPGSEIDRKLKELNKMIAVLRETMTPEQKKLFEECDLLDNELHGLEEEEAFIDGFRLGAGIMSAVKAKREGGFIYSGMREQENQSQAN